MKYDKNRDRETFTRNTFTRNTPTRTIALALLSCVALACSGKSGNGDDDDKNNEPPPPEELPDRPFDAFGWPAAPELQGATVETNRDSVVVTFPKVEGAKDYRVVRLAGGLTVETDAEGREHANGTIIWCAGTRQYNIKAPDSFELLQRVEVPGITEQTDLAIEAVDTQCPFTGVLADAHRDFEVNRLELPDVENFSVYTADEIRARYGSIIVNGQGPGSAVAAPAEPTYPKVLARTKLTVSPKGYADVPTTFFDDFNTEDQPVKVADVPSAPRAQSGVLLQNAKWSFYSYGAAFSNVYVDRGQLVTQLSDLTQNVFASTVAYPRQTVQLSDSSFVHATFEVGSNVTHRRFWWLGLCGAPAAGATMDGNGQLLGRIIQTPLFFTNDGRNPSVDAWNCLQLFARDGLPFPMHQGERPQSDIKVLINTAGAPERESVTNVSPDQYNFNNPEQFPKSWYAQVDPTGALGKPILDDQLAFAPRAKFDVYVRKNRVVLFVNGEQRLCNDFSSTPLSMNEAAIGFGQYLDHSGAEHIELGYASNLRTGQRHILRNIPFVDVRAWDNLGYSQNASLPANFNEALCYSN